MSELLQNWLNNEVGLSTNVANFERDFASGYLFGEVLHKFRQQDDFHLFVNKNTYEAKLSNFKRLEPTLKALGIKVNATQSNAMMNGDRGASLRLLYQLKMATERLLLACDNSGAKGASAARAVPANNSVTKGIRVPREQFDSHEKRFFEHRLRATCPNAKQDRINKVMEKFEQEKNKQEALAFHMDSLEQAHVAEQRQIHRYGQRERLRQNRLAKDDWTRSSIDLWSQNMEKRATCESFDISFANRVTSRQQDKVQKERAHAASEVRDGVAAFETSLAGLGLVRPREAPQSADRDRDSDSDGSGGSELQADRLLAATTPAANARELVGALQARLPNAEELEHEAGLFLQKIKESKRAGSVARKERERRRRRVLVEQQREQDLLEESQLEEVLLEKLGRESVEEKAISYSVWRTKSYEEVIVRHRQLREKEYLARRKRDHEEALQRDQVLREEMLEEMREQEERERVRYRALERGRQAAIRASMAEECENVLDLVLEMVFASVHEKRLTDCCEVDPALWRPGQNRDWMALFRASQPVPAAQSLEDNIQAMPVATAMPTEEPEAGSPAAVMDEAAFRDYVDAAGCWDSQAYENPNGHAIADEATAPHPSRQPPPFDPQVEAKAAYDEAAAKNIGFVDRLKSDIEVVGARPVNYRLGALVAALLDRHLRQPPPPLPPPMPTVPLRLVVTGRPYAGKKTAAGRLAEAYNLQVVDVDELLRECLMLSKRPDVSARPIDVLSFAGDTQDEKCKWLESQGNPFVTQLQQIGYEVQAVLDRGEAISNELYVSMVAAKIRSLFPQRIPQPGGEEAPASAASEEQPRSSLLDAGGSGADGGGGPLEPGASLEAGSDRPSGSAGAPPGSAAGGPPGTASGSGPGSAAPGGASGEPSQEAPPGSRQGSATAGEGGDVFEDAPPLLMDEDASLLLEDSLLAAESFAPEDEVTGWILIGFADDGKRFELLEYTLSGWIAPRSAPTPPAEIAKAKAALVAPAPPQEPVEYVLQPGGYDLHMRLELPADEAVRRAVGRRMDPATSLCYHLEDQPPSSKHQVVYERLVPVDELSNSMGTLSERMHNFDVAQGEVDELLAYFGPFPDVPRLCRIDAHRSTDEVYDSLDEQVATLIERRRAERARAKAEAEAAAEAAAAEAKAAAEAAAAAAEAAAIAAAEAEAAAAAAAAAAALEKPTKGGRQKEKEEPPPAVVEPAVPAAPPPPPIPMDPIELSDLPRLVEKLESSAAEGLIVKWEHLHQDFVSNVHKLCAWQRMHESDVKNGLYGIQRRFDEFLKRPDHKQASVDAFIERFDTFSEDFPDLREQDEERERTRKKIEEDREKEDPKEKAKKQGKKTKEDEAREAELLRCVVEEQKKEMQKLAEALEKDLETQVTNYMTENMTHIEATEKSWTDEQVDVIAAQTHHAVNLEARRYHAACQLLTDFYFAAMGPGPVPPVKEPPPIYDALAVEEKVEPPPDPKAKAKAAPKGKQEEVKVEEPIGDRKRKHIDEKVDEETGNVIPAHWEFPFLPDLMTKARGAIWPTEDWTPPPPPESEEPPEDKAKAKAKAKGRASPNVDKKAVEEPPAEKPQAPPLYVDWQQALIAERVTYAHRLANIRSWAHGRLTAVCQAKAFQQCKDWALERKQKEMHAIGALLQTLNTHIEADPPELITATLTFDTATVVQTPQLVWTVSQLDRLLDAAARAVRAFGFNGGLANGKELFNVLLRLAQGQDLGLKPELDEEGEEIKVEEPRKTQNWRLYGAKRLRKLCNHFDEGLAGGAVDCTDMLFSLSMLHSPLEWPSLDQLLEARRKLEEHMPEGAVWPDYWVMPEEVAELPLLAVPEGKEPHEKYAARAKSQVQWAGRVLLQFPAKLRQYQAWQLDFAWHEYTARMLEEAQRAELQNEPQREASKSDATESSPSERGDEPAAAVGEGDGDGEGLGDGEGGDGGDGSLGPKGPPPPEEPTELPERPEGGISVRQLLAYFCLGATPEEGLARSLAVLGPAEGGEMPVPELHAAVLHLGARPTPPAAGDSGCPSVPSLSRFCGDLGLDPAGAVKPEEWLASPEVKRYLEQTRLGDRHRRAPVAVLFEQDVTKVVSEPLAT